MREIQKKNMDIFWGTMEYDEVFLQHHASQRHVQDGGDVIPEVGVHLDFIFHRSVIHHLEELRHHWQTLQRAVWFYTVHRMSIVVQNANQCSEIKVKIMHFG